jgi:hypothetical protein
MVAFVAVENPAGVLGFKQKGILDNEGASLNVFPASTDKKPWNVKSKDELYAGRYKELQKTRGEGWAEHGLAKDLLADAKTNESVVQKIIKAVKTVPTARVLMCSSVNSMTKYIAKYCQDNNAVIDTLILFGHGGTNSMNIGLGRIGCFDASDIGEQRVMKGRQTLGLEQGGGGKAPRVREISVANQDHWGKCFEALTPFAAAHPDTGAFHVFLLACDLADNPQAKPVDMLVNVTKFVLKPILSLDVVAATPKGSVTSEELLALVKKIDKYCNKAAAGDFGINDVNFVSSESNF